MKNILLSLCILCAISACPTVFAADSKKDMKDTTEDGPVTLAGMMAVKGTDAKKDVVARIEGKKKGHWYNLVATGEIATKIEKLRQEGDKVKVSGKKTGDDIAVESIDSVKNMKK